MPSQRKKNKAMIGGYIERDLAESFKAIAHEQDCSVKDLLRSLIIAELEKHKQPQKGENDK